MRVNPSSQSSIQSTNQSTQTDSAKKTDQAAKTQRARQIDEMAKNAPGPSSASSSKAEISSRAREAAQAHSIAAETPDVREDKVAELKKRIAEGSYKIDSDAIADKMISEHMAL